MCGIAGFWDPALAGGDADATVRRMTDLLAHRGPDDQGRWLDAEAGVALGFRRLAILELSSEGAQPKSSLSGRYVISFNGEIYNHLDLRAELGSQAWRGRSDTETLLACIEQWGVEAALRRANGMWAIALWDRRERELWLSRDRFGKKPLSIARTSGGLAWASELQALRWLPGFDAAVDERALAAFLELGCVPAPLTIHRGARKLHPGTLLRIPQALIRPGADLDALIGTAREYWSAADCARAGLAAPLDIGLDGAADLLHSELAPAVARRCLSDVPLGAFLSGGIDSSLIAALMCETSGGPVRTFCIGFETAAFDEAPAARAIARHLGTDHTELMATAQQALDVIPLLPSIYDEPFADSSQIPTFLVSRLAREHVTVALSGDGGDELFAGYRSYAWVPAIEARVNRLPRGLRQAAARLLRRPGWDRFYSLLRPLLPAGLRFGHPASKIAKLAGVLEADTLDEINRRLVGYRVEPGTLLPDSGPATQARWPLPAAAELPGAQSVQRLMLGDQQHYLSDDILVKLDRASMAVSLEGRCPLLDPGVCELAWRIPLSVHLERGGKSVPRRLLARYVPPELFERPKKGFSVPLAAWLRGPLREWAEDLTSRQRISADGLFDAAAVRRLWAEHHSGRHDHSAALWTLLMYQAWSAQQSAAG